MCACAHLCVCVCVYVCMYVCGGMVDSGLLSLNNKDLA